MGDITWGFPWSKDAYFEHLSPAMAKPLLSLLETWLLTLTKFWYRIVDFDFGILLKSTKVYCATLPKSTKLLSVSCFFVIKLQLDIISRRFGHYSNSKNVKAHYREYNQVTVCGRKEARRFAIKG
jgi:fucose 4-O-acetylase-like acetyltransferase